MPLESDSTGLSAVQDQVATPHPSKVGVSAVEAVTSRPKSLRSALLWTALVMIAFLGADSLLFRTGWYLDYIEPDSSTGQLESHLHWLQQRAASEREVLVVGDS